MTRVVCRARGHRWVRVIKFDWDKLHGVKVPVNIRSYEQCERCQSIREPAASNGSKDTP